jgi:hypothetical protein
MDDDYDFDAKIAKALALPISAEQRKIDSERQKLLAQFNPSADPGVMKAAEHDMAPTLIDLLDGPVQMSAAGIKRLGDLEVERVAKRTKPAAKPTVAKRQKSAKAGWRNANDRLND